MQSSRDEYPSPPDEVAYYAPEAGSASNALVAAADPDHASIFDIFGNLRGDVVAIGPLLPVAAGGQIGPVMTPIA